VPGRRRGARTGRGWDAAPARPHSARTQPVREPREEIDTEAPLWLGEESQYQPRETRDSTGQVEDRVQQSRDPAEQAREICLRLLAVRPRTRAELAQALRKRSIPDEVASAVLDRYREVGMIDDAAFARAWVESRHHGRGLARRALAGELRQRGVDKELVGAALEEVDDQTEAATARELVDRRLRSMGSAGPEVVLRRLVGMLARRGYAPGLAIRVVKEALAAAADERTASYAELLDPDAASDLIGEVGEVGETG
jgi:regulatory protein